MKKKIRVLERRKNRGRAVQLSGILTNNNNQESNFSRLKQRKGSTQNEIKV